jgi:flagellar motor switch protein FliM
MPADQPITEPLPTSSPASPAAPVLPDASAPPVGAAPSGNARRYDFRGPSFLTTTELRKLRLRHDEFARSLATRLSIYLRLEVEAQILDLQTQPFRRFVDSLPHPTHLTLFKIESLSGIGLLQLSPNFGLALVDRLLGGPGKADKVARDLTEIEVETLDLAAGLLLREWCQEVTQLPDAHPQLIGHETNARYLQTASHDTNMLVLTVELHMNEYRERLHLGFPYLMVEPLIRQLAPPPEPRRAEAGPPQPLHWNAELNDVSVPVSAEWTGLQITARELAQLKVGDVLQLDPQQFNHVKVRLARVPKFVGRLGTREKAWAVALTGTVPPC